MRGNFSNDRQGFAKELSSIEDRIAAPTIAQVLEVLPRFRANILTTSGDRYKSVRYPGPFINSTTGNAHGRLEGLKPGQLVLVNFIQGSFRAPIITRSFPFPTKDCDLDAIQNFWNQFGFIDPETDVIDFHESGYMVRQTSNKIEIRDSNSLVVFTLDFTLKKVSIQMDVEIDGNVTLVGNLNQTGDSNVTGKAHVTGKISTDTDVLAQTISLVNHGHTYNPGPLASTRTSNAGP
ncbi:hypothetical protein LEP1GSC050_0010 [Leptospira phage vB_LbrZ_5399-LE1]|uniref:Baseplate assembly protein n=1 Tax=Leptospira inadai serovar Lyme TaxID=293084 RepID=A0ABX4YGR8_9LEPT|nr:hypothetical protein [Leptospira inadai]AGS80708.1 hypothetical protein LEP1GSC050_0010 [Leptospira phage vB_LbrZ_5399-LE1]AGS80867.1 hypothetical protein LEP1GSC047_0860 [Leptospira phage vB_LinZ_10-LE1]PNV74370.1 baseplate assembly protein [Leptospira inadai serovar Lyme]